MLLNESLILLPNIVKSLFSFSVVIFAYIWVVTMFVCPNTRLTLSIGIPFDKARVAYPWRAISKRLDIGRYPNLSNIQTFFFSSCKSAV